MLGVIGSSLDCSEWNLLLMLLVLSWLLSLSCGPHPTDHLPAAAVSLTALPQVLSMRETSRKEISETHSPYISLRWNYCSAWSGMETGCSGVMVSWLHWWLEQPLDRSAVWWLVEIITWSPCLHQPKYKDSCEQVGCLEVQVLFSNLL